MTPNPKPKKKPKKRKGVPEDVREAVFKRDKHTCQYCGQKFVPGDNPPLHCHHIVKKSQGGKDIKSNLNCCCWVYHHNHGEISMKDKDWLNGENVYWGGRLYKRPFGEL